MACSTPPMYWSMGNQYCAIAGSNGRAGVLRVGVAIEVPARIDEGVHRVGLAPRRPAALGAGHVDELRHAAQRRAALLRDLDLLGQHHRQLIVGHRNQAVALAVDHRDRRAPVALAAHAPVLQAEGDLGFAKAACRRRLPGASSALRRSSARRYSPELTSTPSSETNGSASSHRRCVGWLRSPAESACPYLVANSKSRSSWPGTLMMAPVP